MGSNSEVFFENYQERVKVHFGHNLIAYKKMSAQENNAIITNSAQMIQIGGAIGYQMRAFAHVGNGDLNKAIADLGAAIIDVPNVAHMYESRGAVYGEKGDFDKAIADLDKSLQIKPDSANSYYYRSLAYLGKGNFKCAFADCDKALKLFSSSSSTELDAYLIRGFLYGRDGDLDKAIADFEAALRIKVENVGNGGTIEVESIFHNNARECLEYAKQARAALTAKKAAEEAVAKKAALKTALEETRKQKAAEEEARKTVEAAGMKFTVYFLQYFLKELRVFNDACEKIDMDTKEKLSAIDINHKDTKEKYLETYQKGLDFSVEEKHNPQGRAKKVLDELAKLAIDGEKSKKEELKNKDKKINAKIDEFEKKFSPSEIRKEYAEIYTLEPIIEEYECIKKDYTESVRIANLEYGLQSLNLGEHAQALLETNYPFLYRHKKLIIPFCTAFDESFNYLFAVGQEETQEGRKTLVNNARSLVMRLFMMVKPDKVHFIFIDPVMLGDTFALFNKLVDANDRTNRVINEEVCISTEDIDKKLQSLIKYIANVSQNFLQGEYKNIKEYNKAAKQNAVPYQVLMIMDFPGSFKEDSLHKLEKIISTGPKCGVYTVILESSEQRDKLTDEKLQLLVHNIKNQTVRFVVKGKDISLVDADKEMMIPFNIIDPLFFNEDKEDNEKKENLDKVIRELRRGIKDADKTVIKLDEHEDIFPKESEWFQSKSQKGLDIPIGIHGANNVQKLSFGKIAYHALVIGQIGSGKSSLLHTIIMNSLVRYPADELSIYLVDFKQGVEFKIYANHELNAFRVVAIECEREFGGSVLTHLRKEFDDRSNIFRKNNVQKIEDYRDIKEDGKNLRLPRILLIVDEFHILFSKDSDPIGKKAAENLEFIIKEGRSHGFHVILASQSMANIGGIHQSLWGQVGIRIALKCHPDDAKLVLGEGNDGVSLLSADKPGHAVYNSEHGNKAVNQIFRVAYTERKDQDDKLKQISKKQKNLDEILEENPKLELGLSKTRIMVSNIEDNLYHPFQKFIKNGKSDAFNEDAVFIGEPLQLSGKLRANFKAKDNSNMLVVGNDKQKARAMFAFSSLSLSINTLAQNNWKKTSSPCVHIMDFAPLEEGDNDVLMALKKEIPDYVKYEKFNDSIDILKELHQNLQSRGKDAESQYLLIFGLQSARSLRQSAVPYQGQNRSVTGADDDTGLDIGLKSSLSPYQMLCNILQKGPGKKIHSIIWADNFKTFQAHYPGWLEFFDLRIGFTMPNEDSVLFIEEPEGSQISENNAVFSYNGNQKFRPYQMPDSGWLKEICEHINGFQLGE